MSDALRGVMWSFRFPQQMLGKWNHFSRPCARFIWRCFTVAIVAMSLRAFYDRTLIVEALFYTESYFRIQYVLLYNKCIVWRKLNKCCFKTEACFPCLCLHTMQRSLLHVPWLVFTHADLWPQKNQSELFSLFWNELKTQGSETVSAIQLPNVVWRRQDIHDKNVFVNYFCLQLFLFYDLLKSMHF